MSQNLCGMEVNGYYLLDFYLKWESGGNRPFLDVEFVQKGWDVFPDDHDMNWILQIGKNDGMLFLRETCCFFSKDFLFGL